MKRFSYINYKEISKLNRTEIPNLKAIFPRGTTGYCLGAMEQYQNYDCVHTHIYISLNWNLSIRCFCFTIINTNYS